MRAGRDCHQAIFVCPVCPAMKKNSNLEQNDIHHMTKRSSLNENEYRIDYTVSYEHEYVVDIQLDNFHAAVSYVSSHDSGEDTIMDQSEEIFTDD